jgi:hypothetical protein
MFGGSFKVIDNVKFVRIDGIVPTEEPYHVNYQWLHIFSSVMMVLYILSLAHGAESLRGEQAYTAANKCNVASLVLCTRCFSINILSWLSVSFFGQEDDHHAKTCPVYPYVRVLDSVVRIQFTRGQVRKVWCQLQHKASPSSKGRGNGFVPRTRPSPRPKRARWQTGDQASSRHKTCRRHALCPEMRLNIA